jgi:hypothetical protein
MEYMEVEKKERSRTIVYVGLGLTYLCDYEEEVEKVIKQFGIEKCEIVREGK